MRRNTGAAEAEWDSTSPPLAPRRPRASRPSWRGRGRGAPSGRGREGALPAPVRARGRVRRGRGPRGRREGGARGIDHLAPVGTVGVSGSGGAPGTVAPGRRRGHAGPRGLGAVPAVAPEGQRRWHRRGAGGEGAGGRRSLPGRATCSGQGAAASSRASRASSCVSTRGRFQSYQ